MPWYLTIPLQAPCREASSVPLPGKPSRSAAPRAAPTATRRANGSRLSLPERLTGCVRWLKSPSPVLNPSTEPYRLSGASTL